MSMLGYYALHSFVNQIRKLFKTWIAVFIAVCLVLGIGIGFFIGFAVENTTENEEEIQEEVIDEEPISAETVKQIIELVTGGVIIIVLGLCIFLSDKSVSSLFLPADVPLLFASPLKPQTVLIFRLSMQISAIIFSSIYLFFQIPNLMKLNLSIWNCLAIILTWYLTIAWGKIIQVFIYIFGSTHEKFKNSVRTVLLAVVILICGSFFAYFKLGGEELFTSATSFFNGKYSCLIPVWGWLKAIVVCGINGMYFYQFAAIAVNISFGILSVYLIWKMKADYYEEAMAKCEETAALLQSASEGKTVRKAKKKDRSEKLQRDGLNKGFGADIFFQKAMYNRFRFAHFKYFTKTAETYLAIGIIIPLFLKLIIKTDNVLPAFAAIAVLSFFRSLGNPLEEDTKTDFFILIPESMWAKMFYSLLGGIVNCALDIIPAMFLIIIIMKGSFASALLWILLILTVSFYSTCVGAFLDFSIPTSAGKTVKTLIQIMFVYFGLLPDIICISLAAIYADILIGLAAAIMINCLIGSIFFLISPTFLTVGRK